MRSALKTPSAQINHQAGAQIAQFLRQILSDTYILYVKTQNFHWNIVDPRFFFLHEMFEDQYQKLAEGVDELAERIRMLKFKSPGSMSQFLELGTLEEADNDLSGNEMMRQLIQDHEILANNIRPRVEEAIKLGDEGTGDLLISRLRFHEKTAWMLRSHFVEER